MVIVVTDMQEQSTIHYSNNIFKFHKINSEVS